MYQCRLLYIIIGISDEKKRTKISRRNDSHSFRSYGTLYSNIGELNSDEEDVDIRVTRLLLIKFDVDETLPGGEYVGIVRKTLLVKTPSINYLFSSCCCVSLANGEMKVASQHILVVALPARCHFQQVFTK